MEDFEAMFGEITDEYDLEYHEHVKQVILTKYPNSRHRNEKVRMLISSIQKVINYEVFSTKTIESLNKTIEIMEREFLKISTTIKDEPKPLENNDKNIINENSKKLQEEQILDRLKQHMKKDNVIRENKGTIAPFISPYAPYKEFQVTPTENNNNGLKGLIRTVSDDLYCENGFYEIFKKIEELSKDILDNNTITVRQITSYNKLIENALFANELLDIEGLEKIIKCKFTIDDIKFLKQQLSQILVQRHQYMIISRILTKYPNSSKNKTKTVTQFIARIQKLIDTNVLDTITANELKNIIWGLKNCISNKKSDYYREYEKKMYLSLKEVIPAKQNIKVSTISKEDEYTTLKKLHSL